MIERYAGKPFLELLDNYILDAIGALDAESDAALTAREPTFRHTFGETGDWRAIVVKRMRFPDGMTDAVREIWQKGAVKFVAAHGREPDPFEFTRHFVDTNFPH